MSALIELLNTVRRSAHVGWLTPSQRSCYDTIVALARMHSPVVLLGPPGSGKTLIGWLVRRELGHEYTTNPLHLQLAGSSRLGVILDNAELAEVGARELLGQALLRGWTTVVILARAINPEGIPTVRLPAPTESDLTQCLANLQLPHKFGESSGETNIWRAVRRRLADAAMGVDDDA